MEHFYSTFQTSFSDVYSTHFVMRERSYNYLIIIQKSDLYSCHLVLSTAVTHWMVALFVLAVILFILSDILFVANDWLMGCLTYEPE